MTNIAPVSNTSYFSRFKSYFTLDSLKAVKNAVVAVYNKVKEFRVTLSTAVQPVPIVRSVAFAGRQIGIFIGRNFPKITVAASAVRYVHRIVYPNAEGTTKSMAATAGVTFLVCGSLLYYISGRTLTDFLITAAGIIYGAKEGLWAVGLDPKEQDFVGRSAGSLAADRTISVITNQIPMIGTPIRLLANEIVYLGKVNEVRNALPSLAKIREFREGWIGRQIEPLMMGFVGRQLGMLIGSSFPKLTLAAYAGEYMHRVLHKEFEHEKLEKYGVLLTVLSGGTFLWLVSGTVKIDWLINAAAIAYSAKAGLRLVGINPSNNNHWLDSFESRTGRCLLVDRALSVITDYMPVVGTPMRLAAGSITFNAVPLFLAYRTARCDATNYDDYNPATLVQAWAINPDGTSKVKNLTNSVPVPSFFRNWIARFVEDGIKRSSLPNLLVRAINTYAAWILSPDIQRLIKAYIDKKIPKEELENGIYNKNSGLRAYASKWVNPYVEASQILNAFKELEISIFGFEVSDNSSHGELIEILTRGLVTECLTKGQQDFPLKNQEIKLFYSNINQLLGIFYLHGTHPKTQEFAMHSLEKAVSSFLEKGGYLTQFIYQHGRIQPFPKEFEDMLQ